MTRTRDILLFLALVLLTTPAAALERPEISRRETVAVSPGVLATSEPVALDLFGRAVVLEPTETKVGSGGRSIWLGRVRDDVDSVAAFVTSGERVTGYIRVGGASYELHPQADGSHALEEVDVSQLPDELLPVVPERSPPSVQPRASLDTDNVQAADDDADPGDVRLLVVYTPGAAAELVDPESAIELAVALTSDAFENSHITASIELAGMAEMDFGSSDLWVGTQLTQLTSPDDGIADEVHALRDELEADLVMLVTDARGACGVSNLLLDLSIDSAVNAFSVTHFSCMSAGFTFSHELGHAFGAGHDREAGCVGLFPYSCGYRRDDQDDPWRTLMAYPCAGTGCPRILYFSSPDVSYRGVPTGVGGPPDVATDNAKTISLAAPTVASFRGQSVVPRNVSATSDRLDGVMISWSAPPLPIVAYRIERFDHWRDDDPSAAWSTLAPPFMDDSAEINREYYYRVAPFTFGLVQGPASSLVRGFRRSSTCGDGTVDANGEQCDGGRCCDDECLIEPETICGRPVTGPVDATCTSTAPNAADCLRIFWASTGLATCERPCLCDVNVDTSPGITPTDALACLGAAVGNDVSLTCSCSETD